MAFWENGLVQVVVIKLRRSVTFDADALIGYTINVILLVMYPNQKLTTRGGLLYGSRKFI